MQTGHLTNSFPRVCQLNQDFYFSDAVSFLESYRPNRVFRFKIDKSFYLFINYTLAGIAQVTIKLSPLFSINETITSRVYIAYSSLIDYKPIVDRNLNAILATLATTSLRTECFQAFLDSQSNYSSVSSADIHFSDVTHLLHTSFLLLLSSISSPFFNAVLSLLTILALAWGLILTVYKLANLQILIVAKILKVRLLLLLYLN